MCTLAPMLAAWVPAGAQQPAQTPPSFRAAAHLIVQAVTVRDRHGQPVSGLTARDFVVTENGQPQPLAFVEYEALEAASAPASTSRITGGGAAPPPAAAGPPPAAVAPAVDPRAAVSVPGDRRFRGRRLIVLYLDLVGMTFFDQGRALSSVQNYIAHRMTPAEMVAIFTFGGRRVDVKQEFTDDRAALGDAVRKIEMEVADAQAGRGFQFDPGGAFGEDDGTFSLFTMDRQLAALQTAVSDLAALPEVKTLVYFGGGLRAAGGENMSQLRATVNAAVRANVTLNPIDTRGLQALPPMGDATRPSAGGIGMFSGTIAQAGLLRGERERDLLHALAKDTGGRATFDTNDLAGGIADAASAVTGYYLLGYYSTNTIADGRYRRVNVSLTSTLSASLSYRAGYFGAKDFSRFSAFDRERQLAEALKLEDPITDIPMAIEVNYFQISRAEYFVPVSLRMPGNELARPRPKGSSRAVIDVIGEIKDEHGVTIRNARDKLEFSLDPAQAAAVAARPIQYETGFTLLPGNYVLKILARDTTTGRIGTFLRAFSVPNLEREQARLPVSSVVIGSQRITEADALFTVHQKIGVDVAHPLVHEGQRLVPSVTRTFSRGRPLHVFLQAYERVAMRPLVAFMTFYRDGAKVFETEPVGLTTGWDPKTKGVPIRLVVALETLEPGQYDCQVSVLEPSGARSAFWRAQVSIVK
jgi:VWFA-related protein